MRSFLFIQLTLLFASVLCFAKISVPTKNIQITIKRNRGLAQTETTYLFKDQSQWICRNETFPFIDALNDPAKKISRLKKKQVKSCSDSSSLDTLDSCEEGILRICDQMNPRKIWMFEDCLESQQSQSVLKEVERSCFPRL